jgi:DNA topoisomerase-1
MSTVRSSSQSNNHTRRNGRKRVPTLKLVTDPVSSARAAGLRYVTDAAPGFRRRRSGKGFVFLDRNGRRISDASVVDRIRRLAIPPAWTDVWICPDPSGHLQAAGRDARGRKQYRYHPDWRQVRDETKYGRMVSFARVLPRLRRAVDRALAKRGLSREKVVATVVRLLEMTLIRVGNEEYARSNDSFGLTTLRDRHVDVAGHKVRFEFRGKSGVRHSVDLRDRRLARIVKDCQDLPGYELFQYVDESGKRSAIDSADVNGYLRDVMGADFTAKDFRTWAGTVLAAQALGRLEPCESENKARKNINEVVASVAARLGNTKTICRKCYIHPAVIDGYLEGSLSLNGSTPAIANGRSQSGRRRGAALAPEEKAALAFLERHEVRRKNGKRKLAAAQVRAGVPAAWRTA